MIVCLWGWVRKAPQPEGTRNGGDVQVTFAADGVVFHVLAALPQGKNLQYPLIRGWVDPIARVTA
jgi:hypothetical protein